MKRYMLFVGLLAMTIFVSCDKRGKELKEIEAMAAPVDSMIKATPVLKVNQKMQAEELIQEYMEFVRSYPKDTLCPGFLLKSALLYQALLEYKKELEVVEQLAAQYPESLEAQQGLAVAASTSEFSLRDYNAARGYLMQLKEKYPDGPYSTNIDLQIEYVGDPDGFLEAITEKALKASGVADSVDAVK